MLFTCLPCYVHSVAAQFFLLKNVSKKDFFLNNVMIFQTIFCLNHNVSVVGVGWRKQLSTLSLVFLP